MFYEVLLRQAAEGFIAFLRKYAESTETNIDDVAVDNIHDLLAQMGCLDPREPGPVTQGGGDGGP